MCVILLFSGWVLDTRAKFVLACLGVVLLGIGIEAMLCFRRVSDNYFDIIVKQCCILFGEDHRPSTLLF